MNTRTRLARLIPTGILISWLAGCGSETTAPDPVDLTGEWQYSISNAVGGGISCSITNVVLTLTSAGSQLTGTFAAGGGQNVTCVQQSNGVSNKVNLTGTGAMTNVSLSGSDIGFGILVGGRSWTHTGTVNGATMSGTAAISWQFGSNVVPLQGTWSATKQ